ncbi:hypothetical protein DFH28DRAFT_1217798 [Melampsora americana]|nr:hypothetical protein DFH28DRAFT_1217798 [Melampsora americana]
MSSDHTLTPENAKDVENSDGNLGFHPTPSRTRRPKLRFLCPSTKVEDVRLEVMEGRALENRRILTLILDDDQEPNVFNGTSGLVLEDATGTLAQLPYENYTNPAFWLLANRWVFLPEAEDEKCPESVKRKLEEDIAYLKDEEIKVLTNRELFEAREHMMEWAVQKAESDE